MSDTTSTAIVLSPKAREVGGELARIFSDSTELARYTAGPLNRKDARAIGNAIVDYPELNTEHAIAMLAWWASFHGEPIGKWMDDLLSQYPVYDIDLALNYLYEEGIRARADSTLPDEDGFDATREFVPQLLGLLENYKTVKELKRESEISLDQLVTLLGMLGGLKAIAEFFDNPERLEEALLEHQHRED